MTNEDLSVKMYRDFKGIWIPRKLWESRIPLKNLEEIVNAYYFGFSLSKKSWDFLRDRGWAEINPSLNTLFRFTENFESMMKREVQ
jgi:hypothetical protein